MSSLPEDSPSTKVGGNDVGDDEGGHSNWIDPPGGESSQANVGPSDTTRFPTLDLSSRLQTRSLPSSLPRYTSPQSLGRGAGSSAQNSTETARRPPLVNRVTSSRSLFLPSIVYSGEDDASSGRDDWRATAVGATPLDCTMDRIGMGRYQWTVLILSGLGWAADNMWIQAVAIILPHIQRYFALTDGIVGLASSSIFVGMFVGSIAWGTISDSYGRRAAFNITLAVAAIFGSLSAFAPSFTLLCLLLFMVGTGVGGSMPTDSSNLVENLPVRKHSYVTALSVFFSAGSVVSSLVGLMFLSAKNKEGWRWLVGALAFVTVLFVSARVVFFRLLESPKYLVHAGRPQEARDILQRIHTYNGGADFTLHIQDVDDSRIHIDPNVNGDVESHLPQQPQQRLSSEAGHGIIRSDYRVDDDDAIGTPGRDGASRPLLGEDDGGSGGISKHTSHERNSSASAYRSTETQLPASLSWLPESWHSSAADLVSRYSDLFSPEWKRTTVLVWIIWGGMSYGFTTFNVLLPKLLEQRHDSPVAALSQPDDASIRRAMIDILVYSLSSLPGSLVSAYMVETRLGRIGTMVSSTAVMAASVLLFSLTYWRSSLTAISVSSSISYAAIYGYTPEIMAPTIRATACGTASAISRVAGIIAPILAGWAFSLAPAVPLFMATSVLLIVTAAMALLPIETRGRALDGSHANGDDTTAT